MKFYGDVDVGNNYMSNVVLTDDGQFKTNPRKGTLVFNGNRVYICAEIINDLPIWAPLTNEITTKVVNFETAATTWTVTHNLNSSAVTVQIFDENQKMVIPDDVTIVSSNELSVTFGKATAGMAVCVYGSTEGVSKVRNSYTHEMAAPALDVTVQHNLGYNPNVAVYVGDVLILPSSIVHNSLFSTSVAFTDPTTGTIRFT